MLLPVCYSQIYRMYTLILIVSDAVKQKFPATSDAELRQAIRQKCSNAVKVLKSQSTAAALKSTADDSLDDIMPLE